MTRLILEIGNFLNGKQESGYDILASLPKVMEFKDFVTKKPLLYHVVKVRPVSLDRPQVLLNLFKGFVREELSDRSKFLRRKVNISQIEIYKKTQTPFSSVISRLCKKLYISEETIQMRRRNKKLSVRR